jgi:hypothetical protein
MHTLVISLRREERDIDNQAGMLGNHDRRSENTGNVVGTDSSLEHRIPTRNRNSPEPRFLPDLCPVAKVFIAAPNVIDQDIQTVLLSVDTSKYRFNCRFRDSLQLRGQLYRQEIS